MVSTSGATEWSCSSLKHALAKVDRMSMSVKYHLRGRSTEVRSCVVCVILVIYTTDCVYIRPNIEHK